MNRVLIFSLPLLLIFVSYGCDKISGDKPDSPVIATIDDSSITRNDFIREVSNLPVQARSQYDSPEKKQELVNRLIDRELLYNEALRMKLDNNSEYKNAVKDAKKNILAKLLIRKEVLESTVVDEAEVKFFFEENSDKITTFRASLIVVETLDDANSVMERISKGESFASLAKALSIHRESAEKGGDLGYLGQGSLHPTLEKVLIGLKEGEVSRPIKTPIGYHILKVVDIRTGGPENYDVVKGFIRNLLARDKQQSMYNSFIEKLKNESNINTIEEEIAAINIPGKRPGPAEAEAGGARE